jgi:hypothetical protein
MNVTRTVWVNKRSGVAHRRDCEWLRGVPDGALRMAMVEVDDPRVRLCQTCRPLGSSRERPAALPT